MDTKKTLVLHLSLLKNVGPDAIFKVINSFEMRYNEADRDFTILYSYSSFDFQRLGLSQSMAELVCTGLKDGFILRRELQLIEDHDVKIFAWYESGYPSMLKAIHLPPAIIYVQGIVPDIQYVGIVGARLGDRYGYTVTRSLVPGLVAGNCGIVSGGAAGIDAFAHQATLDCGGITVVVLGGGLLRPYPASNRKLFENVTLSGGGVISAFPLEMESLPGNFPARNRIIAGMASTTVVVQAAAKSGALITAQYALQEGRSVGAVPGAIDNHLSAGCHSLIAQGARLVCSSKDILEECGIVPTAESCDISDDSAQMKFLDSTQQNKDELAHLKKIKKLPLFVDPKREETKDPLLDHCRMPLSIADLSVKTGLSQEVVGQKLFELQLEGKVQQDFAGLWQQV